MAHSHPPVGPITPPESWSEEAKAQILEARKRFFGSETPDDPDTIPHDMDEGFKRARGIQHLFDLLGVIPDDPDVEAVWAEIREMSTDDIFTAAEDLQRQIQKLIIRHLLETHPPLTDEQWALIREVPDELRQVLLPIKMGALAVAVDNGVYDELIAEGVVPGSKLDEDAQEFLATGEEGHSHAALHGQDPFAKEDHSVAVSKMRDGYKPFSGGTVSLNDLFAGLGDDDTIN